MSFKSYARVLQPDGLWLLSAPQPIVFSGRHGLIARFVEQQPGRASESWQLSPDELHTLALPGSIVRERVVLFELVEDGTLELLWLRDVRGVSDQRTEMLFSFTPLRVERAQPQLLVREPAGAPTYGEDLSLDGGVLNLDGGWQWRKPHLALGGVRLGPAKR